MTLALVTTRLAMLDRRLRAVETDSPGSGGTGPGGGVAGFTVDPATGHLRVGYAGVAPDLQITADGRLTLEV